MYKGVGILGVGVGRYTREMVYLTPLDLPYCPWHSHLVVATNRQYASYWNAFLFCLLYLVVFVKSHF